MTQADREWRRQKRAATRDAYRVTINQRTQLATRRALEWIGTSNARLVFRYEYQTCYFLIFVLALTL